MKGRLNQLKTLVRQEWPVAIGMMLLWGVLMYVGMGRFEAWGYYLGFPAAAVTYLTMRGLRFNGWVGGILVIALALYSVYFSYTAPPERNFDLGAEMEYVDYIVDHHALPPADACFVCHHPPLFYMAAAPMRAWYRTTKGGGMRQIQVQSLGYCGVLLVFSALIFRRTLPTERAVTASVALMAFWPYTILNSIRLHNDVLAGTLMVVSVYFALRFHQQRERWSLGLGALFGMAAALTKVNGYAAVAAVGVVGAVYILQKRGRTPVIWAILVTMTLAATLHMGGRGLAHTDSVSDEIFGSAGTLPGRHPLGNAPSNFLSIDLGMYLDEPYVLARRDGTGRQSYPHQLLKSSLFSTGNRAMDLELSYRFNSVIASGLGILLLGMFFVSLFRLATSRPAELARHLPLLVFGSVLLSAHLLFRISEAVGHHGDFRHVYPVLVAAIPLFMAPVDRWVRHGRAAGFVGYFWVVSFIFGSGLYFTPKQALVDSVQLEPRRFEVPLDQLSMTKKKGTDWNHVDNIFIPRDAYLAIPMPQQRVDEIEFTVDWNDTYEVKILGPNRAHVTVVRPPKPRIKGLMFHRMKIHPPMPGAHEIQIRHVSGDNRYIVGHFVVNPGPSEPVGRVERR